MLPYQPALTARQWDKVQSYADTFRADMRVRIVGQSIELYVQEWHGEGYRYYLGAFTDPQSVYEMILASPQYASRGTFSPASCVVGAIASLRRELPPPR